MTELNKLLNSFLNPLFNINKQKYFLEQFALNFSPSNETITYSHALQNFTRAILNFRGIKYEETPAKLDKQIDLENWKKAAKSELEDKLKNIDLSKSFLSYGSRNNKVGESDDLEDYVIKMGENLEREYGLTRKFFEYFYPKLKVLYPVALKKIQGKDCLFLKEVITDFEDNYDVPSDLNKTLDIFRTLVSNSQALIGKLDWWNTGAIFEEFKLIYAKKVLGLISRMQSAFKRKHPGFDIPIFYYSNFEIPKDLVINLASSPRTISHGDLNLGNIISTERNNFLIDFTTMVFAHPLYDASYFLEQQTLDINEASKNKLLIGFFEKSDLINSFSAYDKISVITNQKIAKRYRKYGNSQLAELHEEKARHYLSKLGKKSISR